MDIESVKSQFPIFKNKINGKPLIYLDSANSSQKPKRVIDRISKFYQKEFSNNWKKRAQFSSDSY